MDKPTRQIVIDPVTRIEGHAKITIHFNDQGTVEDARFHVTEFRGFEKFTVGRLVWEMPGITSRICGICPVSHLLTSAKAGDDILAVEIPRTAENLRRVLNLGQWVQSHALSFFHLSLPDLLLGMDADPAKRNIFGVAEANPELARRGIRLRKWGQEVLELLGGRKIHPLLALPGGVRAALSIEKRDAILDGLPEAYETTMLGLQFIKAFIETNHGKLEVFGNFPTLFMGLVTEDGGLEYYDGYLRLVDSGGNIVADKLNPKKYRDYIGEAIEDWSYLKFPYYVPLGYPQGNYRVGPLARLNVCSHTGSPKSDKELLEFKQMAGTRNVVLNSFYYHYARMIEILFALERIEELLTDPDTVNQYELRSRAYSNKAQGVGVCEAPRGTLFHNYIAGHDGVIRHVDMVIATGQNNLSMNRAIRQIAMHYINDPEKEITEGILNRIEAGIRCFDPCLSCSTHALGKMPMRIDYVNAAGAVFNRFERGGR
ncbi:MAG TPA: Ni/Fe hydrogenase subunit alpha [Bacteroidota bacterium]|nr:Ni/Fe hydrogenase subunit alpha [Bacteroidota bacterium]